MNRIFAIALLILLSLSACASSTPDTSTTPDGIPVDATATQSVDEILEEFEQVLQPTAAEGVEVTSVFPTLEIVLDPDVTVLPFPTAYVRTPDPLELPLNDPRTLTASETQDPNGFQTFERITLEVSGGPLIGDQPAPPSRIEITNDGRITRDSRQGTIDQGSLDTLNMMINTMNFFGAQGNFVGNFGAEDTVFYYSITVRATSGAERIINAHEGMMPVEMQSLIGQVLVLSARAQ